jgi:hypothetical protein
MKFHHLLLGAAAAIAFSATVSAADSKDVLYDGVDLEPSGNPIFTDAWTCDPAPLVVGDRLYVYTGEDIYKDGENIGLPGNYNIADWRVYSTTDMIHWRSHGVKLRPEDFPNGKKGIAWAAQCIQKGDKFYWYVTYNTPSGGQCIGVAIGDTPVGPFKPHPKPLVEDKDTPGRGWNDIDPTVLIDDDGTAWLAWGQNSFIAKLKDNMTEIDGEITDLKLQRYIEGPWLYKRNGLYYNIYAGSGGGGGETINYSTAEKPRGPWTFRGQVTGPARNSFTIHPGVVDFKGHTYLFYHNGTLNRDGQRGQSLRRSVCVDELFFNEDGTIKEVVQTQEGIAGKAAGNNAAQGQADQGGQRPAGQAGQGGQGQGGRRRQGQGGQAGQGGQRPQGQAGQGGQGRQRQGQGGQAGQGGQRRQGQGGQGGFGQGGQRPQGQAGQGGPRSTVSTVSQIQEKFPDEYKAAQALRQSDPSAYRAKMRELQQKVDGAN